MYPQVILLFSGKRKSGKDFLTSKLSERLAEKCEVLKISEPIKRHWAKEKNLNLNELLSDSEYKEQYRQEMIEWSEQMRKIDYGYFCRLACREASLKPVWIVSDIRRKTDLCWFKENYGDRIKTIRITADEDTRKERGYQFQAGVDDVTSECDLDECDEWNLIINNGAGKESIEEQIKSIIQLITDL